jgi:hypothetical protein
MTNYDTVYEYEEREAPNENWADNGTKLMEQSGAPGTRVRVPDSFAKRRGFLYSMYLWGANLL